MPEMQLNSLIGVNELTALAVTSELAPVASRGKYVAVLVFSIVPFVPSVLYAQLIAYHYSWRWLGLFCGLWAFIGLVMVACFFFPPPRAISTLIRDPSWLCSTRRADEIRCWNVQEGRVAPHRLHWRLSFHLGHDLLRGFSKVDCNHALLLIPSRC